MTLAHEIALALYPKREDERQYPMFLAYRERAERTVESVLSRQTSLSVTEAAREIESIWAGLWTKEQRIREYESILTRLRAQDAEELRRRDAAIKVATDALEECKKRGGEYCTETIAIEALAAIDKELKP